MKIQILGPGCPKCKKLYANAEIAVKELGIEADLEKIEDIQEISKHGILMTPGLVLDGKVVSSGRVLSPKDIVKHIQNT
ncbi:MAG: redox-active disulfide protein 2 [Candidatus Schekmanbacteria bacterium RBG_13_48_7]|uniref:Redox-active disulfide protein 2 n=1 Tax=Candidatus Schekmanbacteria bacterium RBG_13_48_7 TaxID=1817878 RepID=A0A1F7RPP6_9BACT|nr:MAG: redox-active disulfide protein 2 [Candidatus Schekmanbacteria bacterium RBG_13_48_7]